MAAGMSGTWSWTWTRITMSISRIFLIAAVTLTLTVCAAGYHGNSGDKKRVISQSQDRWNQNVKMEQGDYQCVFCEASLKPIIGFLRNRVDQSLTESVATLCEVASINAVQCLNLTDALAKEVRQSLDLELKPLKICTAVKICGSGKSLHFDPRVDEKNDSYLCEMCEAITRLIEDTVTDVMNVTEVATSHFCHHLTPPACGSNVCGYGVETSDGSGNAIGRIIQPGICVSASM